MTTTSALDLLAHADLLTRQLRDSDVPITSRQWATFDATVYRLMSELNRQWVPPKGTPRTTLAVLRSYPDPPWQTPTTQISTSRAAKLKCREADYFRPKVRRGNLHAVQDNGVHLVAGNDLDTAPGITPADLSDPHLLARIACTLGAAADLLVAARQVEDRRLIGDAQLAGTYVHILSLTYSAARHAIGHGAVADADRPLAIAQYAQRSVDALRDFAERPLSLVRLTSTEPSAAPSTVNDRLESAVDHWTKASEPELMRLVPSADTLRMLANQGAHLFAVHHQVLKASRYDPVDDEPSGAHSETLLNGTRAFHAADKAWDTLTTASRASAEFVTASRELFNALNEVGTLATHPAHDWDMPRGMRDLSRCADSVAHLMDTAQTLPDRLLRSGLVYAPARVLPTSLTRMRSQNRGRYVTVMPAEAPELQTRWAYAALGAQRVQQSIDSLPTNLPALEGPGLEL